MHEELQACGIAHTITHTAHGSAHSLHTDCSCQHTHGTRSRGLSTDQIPPSAKCAPHQRPSLVLQGHTPVTSRDPQGGSAPCCPRMPSLQPVLGHTPGPGAALLPRTPASHQQGFSFTLHFQPGMAVLNSIWGKAGGAGERATSTFTAGRAGEPPQPQTSCPQPRASPARSRAPVLRFWISGLPPLLHSCLPRGLSQPAWPESPSPDPSLGPFAHGESQHWGAKEAVGQWDKISPSSHCHCFYSSSPQVS